MNPPNIETVCRPRLFEPNPLRVRAELPALPRTPAGAAMHDFLVPVLWPDLSPLPERATERTEGLRCLDPDSMFWSPAAHGGDAA